MTYKIKVYCIFVFLASTQQLCYQIPCTKGFLFMEHPVYIKWVFPWIFFFNSWPLWVILLSFEPYAALWQWVKFALGLLIKKVYCMIDKNLIFFSEICVITSLLLTKYNIGAKANTINRCWSLMTAPSPAFTECFYKNYHFSFKPGNRFINKR